MNEIVSKDVYVIINGMAEDYYKFPPIDTIIPAKETMEISPLPQFITEYENNVIYIPELEIYISAPYLPDSVQGLKKFVELYKDKLENPSNFSDSLFNMFPEINTSVLSPSNPNGRYSKLEISDRTIRLSRNISGITEAKLQTALYFPNAIPVSDGTTISEEYIDYEQYQISSELIRNIFKVKTESRTRRLVFRQHITEDYKYIDTEINPLQKIATWNAGLTYNKGFTFYNTLFYPETIENVSGNRILGDFILQNVIITGNFAFLCYGKGDCIYWIEVFEKEPSGTPDEDGFYSESDFTDDDKYVFVRKIHVGDIYRESNRAIGFTIIPLNTHLFVIFHTGIGEGSHFETTDGRSREYFSSHSTLVPSDISYFENYNAAITNNFMVQRSNIHENFSQVIPVKYRIKDNDGLIHNFSGDNISVFTNIHTAGLFSLFNPFYDYMSNIITGDKVTNMVINSNDTNGIIYNRFIDEDGNDVENYYNETFFGSDNFNVIVKEFQKRRDDLWETIDNNLSVDDITSYTVAITDTGLPTVINKPIFRIRITLKNEYNLSNNVHSVSLNPNILKNIGIKLDGIYIEGEFPNPSKIVIPPKDIRSISLTRGSLFSEHAEIVIFNEDSKYDYLYNLLRYNVIIAVDYTKEYEISGNELIKFINPTCPAEELNIPLRCVAIYRGVSDFEIPVSEKIYKLENDGFKISDIVLHTKSYIHLSEQAVPVIPENFNFIKHTEAIKRCLERSGISPSDIIIETNHEDSDVNLQPPHFNIKGGFVLEPPQPFSSIIKKICNEFSGWMLIYSPYSHKFIYEPRRFKINTENTSEIYEFFISEDSFMQRRQTKPTFVSKIISDIDRTKKRPIGTNLVIYGGTVIPMGHIINQSINERAVEDISYKFYVGKDIVVIGFSPISNGETLKMILSNMSRRILVGHEILNFRGTGVPPRFGTPCYVDGINDYGIIKNCTINYTDTDKSLITDYEIEMVNHVTVQGNKLVMYYDEL